MAEMMPGELAALDGALRVAIRRLVADGHPMGDILNALTIHISHRLMDILLEETT